MKRLTCGGALVGALALGAFEVQTTSAPNATATGTAVATAGWTVRGAVSGTSAARDLRQASWADSATLSKEFDTREAVGVIIYVR